MALPMPVASRMQPRKTKIGTDRRMMLDMPSSMRPIITKIGTRVLKARKASVPMPKQKAIGTPMTRHSATTPTRKMRMLMLPSRSSAGDRSQNAPARAATSTTDKTRSRRVDVFTACATMKLSMAKMPNAMAATRKLLGMLRAAEVTYHSSSTYSTAGCSMTSRNVAVRTRPRVWMKPWILRGNIPRNSVSLRCSFRSMAMAAPSMASQRNEIEAASSIQTTG